MAVLSGRARVDSYQDSDNPMPAGINNVTCIEVTEPFSYTSKQWGDKTAIRIIWKDDSGRTISRRYNVPVNSNGEIDIPDWTKHPDKPGQREYAIVTDLRSWNAGLMPGDDTAKLVGKRATLFVEHRPKDKGGVFADVRTVMPAMTAPTVVNHNPGVTSGNPIGTGGPAYDKSLGF